LIKNLLQFDLALWKNFKKIVPLQRGGWADHVPEISHVASLFPCRTNPLGHW